MLPFSHGLWISFESHTALKLLLSSRPEHMYKAVPDRVTSSVLCLCANPFLPLCYINQLIIRNFIHYTSHFKMSEAGSYLGDVRYHQWEECASDVQVTFDVGLPGSQYRGSANTCSNCSRLPLTNGEGEPTCDGQMPCKTCRWEGDTFCKYPDSLYVRQLGRIVLGTADTILVYQEFQFHPT
jgi:hypothetical protein